MEVLLFLVILCSVTSIASSVTNTLKQGDALNSSSVLVSSNNNFTLRFFTPDGTNKSYLAIMFTAMDGKPVWIGNRDSPLPTNSSATLQIDSSGRLILSYNEAGRGKPYLLSLNQTIKNVSAILLDSGNLVLREVSTNNSLWSSFDNPTDTLLPGMKLGVNHRMGRNWTLTSWLRDNTPATGAFSLEWDPTEARLILKNRGVVRWSSGELINATDFQHVPVNPGRHSFKYVNISTNEEEYFSYEVTPSPFLLSDEIENRLAGWRLSPGGVLFDINGGFIAIDVGSCYGYKNESQQSRGCELWEHPTCRGGGGETFEERSGRFMKHTENGLLNADPETTPHNISGSLSDCRENCWNDCDCVGYQSFDDSAGSYCGYWKGTDLQFEQDNTGNTVHLYVLIGPVKGKSRSKKWLWILVPATISIVLVVLLVLRRRRRKREVARKEQELKDLLTLEEYNDIIELSNGENGSLKVFSYAWIVSTTNNFSSDYKLGQGGFGSVYKGVTPEGQEVAIKQLSETSTQGLVEFKNEVVLIAKLQHTNLVKLIGFCIHGDQKMLIYEFMPNKSLDFYLFDQRRNEYLTWEKRLNIIEGIAQGLLYLHKYSRVRIIHRDMKASNILLDENMNPKISDFGMAKILRQNVTEANTIRLGGTFGYMAPEYAMEGIFSTKSDVYSFGVLVLEIVSGKKNNHFRSEDGPLNLVEHAWELWNKDAMLHLVDPTIRNSCGNEEQLRRCINVGLLCVEDFAVDRPSMSDVLSMFSNENLALPKPKKPAFVSRVSVLHDFQEDKSKKFTTAELSISAMEGR